MKKPEEGDLIEHKYLSPSSTDELERVGWVDWVGSSQFAYVTENGGRFYCMFSEQWKKLG